MSAKQRASVISHRRNPQFRADIRKVASSSVLEARESVYTWGNHNRLGQ